MTQEDSQREGRLDRLLDTLVKQLLEVAQDEDSPMSNADKRLAFDIIKYQGVKPVKLDVPEETLPDSLPFDSIDQEVV